MNCNSFINARWTHPALTDWPTNRLYTMVFTKLGSHRCCNTEYLYLTPPPQESLTSQTMSNYYDLDDFLAQEELIPTKTLFDYWQLGHLDPNNKHRPAKNVLPKHTTLKLPVWVIQKWAGLGFCQISLPKPFQLTETSLLVSPKPSFFESAMAVVHLCETSSHSTYQALRNHPSSNNRRLQFQHLEQLLQSVQVLRNKLVSLVQRRSIATHSQLQSE